MELQTCGPVIPVQRYDQPNYRVVACSFCCNWTAVCVVVNVVVLGVAVTVGGGSFTQWWSWRSQRGNDQEVAKWTLPPPFGELDGNIGHKLVVVHTFRIL